MSCTNAAIGTPWSVGEAVAALQQRLNDAGGIHWTSVELQRYLLEALRTLSAYTQRYRNRGTFSSVGAQTFYDLPTVVPSLRGYNVTSQDLIVDIEYALMEPPTPTSWTGTAQFNLALILEAINSRLNQFLLETGAVQTHVVYAGVTPDAAGRIVLDESVMTIRRLAWVKDGITTPLRRDDEWGMTHYALGWPTQYPSLPARTWPTAYSVGVTPPLTVQLAPPPPSPGSLDVVAVSVGATLTTGTVPLGIPDDWSWVIKWGALAELLSRDGVAYDPTRAAYCEARWQQGVQMARVASVVLNGAVNGNLMLSRSLAEIDAYRRNWQNASGTPSMVVLAGQNLVALNTPPDGTYTVELDMVQNVPVFTIGDLTDCLAVDEPMRDVFLDYAQHLAVWKEGPQQAQSTMALFERFQRLCGVQQMVDAASVPTRGPLLQQTVQDERAEARMSGAEPTVIP